MTTAQTSTQGQKLLKLRKIERKGEIETERGERDRQRQRYRDKEGQRDRGTEGQR